MFDELQQAVESLQIPCDPDAVAAVVTISQRLQARVSAALAELDSTGLFDTDGSSSLTGWLRNHGCTRRDAAAQSARARRLAGLPTLRRAWATGTLSTGHIDAVLAVLNSRNTELFAQHETELVSTLIGLSVNDTAQVMSEWRRHSDALLDEDDRRDDDIGDSEPPSRLYNSPVGGRHALDGDLDNRIGQLLTEALRIATTPDAQGQHRSQAERRADALACASAQPQGVRGATPADPPEGGFAAP